MAAVIHAKNVKGKKVWYVWGANGNDKWERPYPQCRSKSAFYDVLREEIGLPRTASNTDVVFALFNKTWDGSRWVDDFSLRLKSLREAAGLKQAELAHRAGLSVQAIAALEQGARRPTWQTVRRLAIALDVGEEEFKVKLPVVAQPVA
ncbi:MAG: helix-turn-helix transcriptional regulator [Planctomycetes bacterium]|nr:helix-turn-helix transcriptional regulator [Planctomycetota bacterium]